MIRFASQVIEVGKLFPKVEKRQKFVKLAMGPDFLCTQED